MKIKVDYINNIKTCELEIEKNELNVLYGHNGTGKSSIAMAIKSKLDKNDLSRYQSLNYPSSLPNVSLSDDVQCEIFNTDFIDTVVFNRLDNSFVKNSFELLVKDANITTLEKEVLTIKNDIVNLTKEESFLSLKKSLEYITNTLPLKQKGKSAADRISKTKGFKNIAPGNPVLSIKVPIKIRRIAKSQKNTVQWAKWWKSGKDYIFDERCPFCGDTHKVGFSKDIQSILDVLSDANFDTRLNLTNHVDELNKMINKNGDGFSEIVNSNKDIYKETNAKKILSYVININELTELLNAIYIFDIDKGESKDLVNHLIQLLKYLTEPTMMSNLSELIKLLKAKDKDLKISKNKINTTLRRNITSKETTINQYLELCNIEYEMAFRDQALVLIHKPSRNLLDGVRHLLSYGEKNAIALLIFALLNVNKDKLLILDDPISSYDEEKKYAIYSMLFKKSQLKLSKGNYLIYFTHDFENVIEFINNGLYQREIKGYMLTNKLGEIVPQSITKSSINLIKDYYLDIISYTNLHFVKLIYIRKLIELKFITENTLHTYNYISSVVKGNTPSYKTSGNKLTEDEVSNAIKTINQYDKTYVIDLLIKELELEKLLNAYNQDNIMWFEKTVLFRAIAEKSESLGLKTVLYDSLDRLSKMSYHIENERVLNLNPISFNIFPSNIEKAMDLFVNGIESQYKQD